MNLIEGRLHQAFKTDMTLGRGGQWGGEWVRFAQEEDCNLFWSNPIVYIESSITSVDTGAR